MKWFIHSEDEENDRCWTITNTEGVPGWDTRNGSYGTGLPREVAKAIVECLNKADLEVPYKALIDKTRWKHSNLIERWELQ